ncbi:MAG: cation transporter dimerization domain-containing protein, partial [Rhodoplanes sp.]
LQARRLRGRNAPEARVAELRAALAELAVDHPILRNVHDVRVRETPEGELVVFHCTVDPLRTVMDVHQEVDALESDLRRRFPGVRRVIGHAEPRDHARVTAQQTM